MSSFRKKILVTLIGVGLGLPLLVLIWYSAGSVQGTEFSPDDFSIREFSYNRDPLFGWILADREVVPVKSGILQELVADGWIKPVVQAPQTWHLVSEGPSDGNRRVSKDCDARFLTMYLQMMNADRENFWTVWNMDFPAAAKVFWPLIADLARDQMYLKIPEIMQYAMDQRPTDAAAFDAEIHRLAAAAYLQLGQIDLEQGLTERARHRAGQSNRLLPSTEASQLQRAASEKSASPTGETP